MYVCVCKAVNDRQIREAYENGACSMRLLNQQLGVGSCCGRCARCARDVLRQCHQECQQSEVAVSEAEPALMPVATA